MKNRQIKTLVQVLSLLISLVVMLPGGTEAQVKAAEKGWADFLKDLQPKGDARPDQAVMVEGSALKLYQAAKEAEKWAIEARDAAEKTAKAADLVKDHIDAMLYHLNRVMDPKETVPSDQLSKADGHRTDAWSAAAQSVTAAEKAHQAALSAKASAKKMAQVTARKRAEELEEATIRAKTEAEKVKASIEGMQESSGPYYSLRLYCPPDRCRGEDIASQTMAYVRGNVAQVIRAAEEAKERLKFAWSTAMGAKNAAGNMAPEMAEAAAKVEAKAKAEMAEEAKAKGKVRVEMLTRQTPPTYPLVCRGTSNPGGFSYSVSGDTVNLRFSKKGTLAATQGIAQGECAWFDRGLSPNEPGIIDITDASGTQKVLVQLEELRKPSTQWVFEVYNAGGVFKAVSTRRNDKPFPEKP